MDFITKLPRTAKGHDTIWVIVDRLMKSAHLLPIHETFLSKRLAEVFINEVVAWHGVPLTIVSDRDTRFTSRCWKRFHEAMGTRLNISTAYHPQTDGQSKRTIQTLQDMLRACIIDFGGSWDSHLPLAEFSYNNSHHTTIGMPPYEMLYGRKYESAHVPLTDIEVNNNLYHIAEPVAILDHKEKRLRNKVIQLVKVQWKHRKGSEDTWEMETEMRESYPYLLEL
ncbi:hypothetical protein L1987_74351 [Smallanthus sonchifolius]|uniref:Uncharacterized protein n=1 Tax=Smallanthus sonchifolius TaxID=185202 RepID=A0ACB9A1Q1_9ASTR|nr:hypothetical protein L1987_74351 [Smallanthus sonchifolius]